MLVEDFLNEVRLGSDPEIEKIFNGALEQVYSKEYLNKINDKIKKTIKIKHTKLPGTSPTASVGRVIEIDDRKFNPLSTSQKMRYLLHEFIHILQVSRSFFIFKTFKEMGVLTNQLMNIFRQHGVKPYSVFLTGQNQPLGAGGKNEVLAYLMNDSLNTSALTPQGKHLFKKTVIESKLFNVNNKFWVKRLSKF